MRLYGKIRPRILRGYDMIIVQLAGGLGNQMQQYALYRRFLSLGTEAELDASWFLDLSRQGKGICQKDL